MAVVFKNNAKTTLASGITSSATSITVADGSVFPTLTGSDTFFCTLDDGTNIEIVEVTAISSNTLTVTRAQDNTSATSFSTGTVAELRLTAGILNLFSQTGSDINAEVEAYLDANGLTLPDGVKAQFGAGSDLQIYSDGTDGYIDNVTGDFYIRDITGGTLHLQAKSNEEGIVIHDDGGVDLYRNNVLKMSTTSSGIDVTGTVTSDGLTVDGTTVISASRNLTNIGSISTSDHIRIADNKKLLMGSGDMFQIGHITDHSQITTYEGDLYIDQNADDKDIIFRSDNGSGGITDYIRLDGSHGQIKLNKQTIFSDSVEATFGTSGDAGIYHNGTHLYIDEKDAGRIFIRSSDEIRLNKYTGEFMVRAIADGAVELYNNNNLRLETTSTGIDVTGEGKFTDLTNGGLVHARGLDASLFLDVTSGNNAKIYYDSGDLEFKATNPTAVDSSVSMKIAQNRDISFYEDTGTTAKFFWDASAESLTIGGVAPQTNANFNLRRNGTNIEFGHNNRTSGYYGTLGAFYNNGQPYLGFSADANESGNTFNTRGFKGNLIYGNTSGDLIFAQLTNANATGQTPTTRLTINSSGNATFAGTINSGAITASGSINLTAGQVKLRSDVALDHDGSSLYIKAPSSIYFYPNNTNHGRLNTSGTLTVKAYQVNGTTVIDSSRNLKNLGFIDAMAAGGDGAGSQVIKLRNPSDSSYATDALTAYNATTSWDISDKVTLSQSSRANAGSIYTYLSQNNSEAVAYERFVQLSNSNANSTYGMRSMHFYQYDGSGTSGSDMRKPSGKLLTVHTYEAGTVQEQLSLDSDGDFSVAGTISSGAITSTGDLAITGNVAINSDDLVVSSSNSRVGINVGTPLATLDIDGDVYVRTGHTLFTDILRPYATTTLTIGQGTNDIAKFTGSIQIGNFTIVDSSRNLTNIGTISSGNITTTGYLRGPSTFTIDPATHGDDTGTVVIAGNLQVDGTTTTINSTTLTVDDKNITLASGSTNAAAANGAGLTVDCGSDTDATFTYDGTNDEWDFNKNVTTTGHYIADTHFRSSDSNATLSATGGGGVYLRPDGNSNSANQVVIASGTGNATFSGYVSSTALASPDGTQIVFPNNNSNVMIGSTATPASKLHVNSGGTNVVATFQSTDGIAGIKLQDSGGNVELSASGSTFRVQPSGGTPVLEVDSSGNTDIAGTISSGAIASSSTGTFVGDGAVGPNALNLLASNNGSGVGITFSDNGTPPVANANQRGQLLYYHGDGQSYGSGNAFVLTGTESTATILADGKLMFKEGLYIKPSSGTGAGTQIIDSSGNISQSVSNKTHGGYVYGRNIGMSDQMDLFAISDFDDDISLRRKFERADTHTSWTKVDDSDAPASGVFDVDSNQSLTWGPYIPIDDDTEIIFETWMKHVSGTDTSGNFYAGAQFYDGSKTSLGNNTRYWGSAGDAQDADNTSWRHIKGVMRGDAIRAQSATSTAKYMRFLVLFNYNTTANKTRFCGFRYYRSKLTVSSLYLKPNASTPAYQDSNPQTLESDTAPVVIDGSRRHYGNNTATNTTPQFTFAGDPDTGLGYIGSDAVGLIAGASRKFYVNNTTAYFQNLSGGVDIDATISSGAHTITSTGTIGTSTPGNGYLQVTDGSTTLALDPNEIYSSDDLIITTGGDFDIRNGSFSMGNEIVITSSKNIINVGTITASGLITGDRFLSGLGTVGSPAFQVGDTDSGFYDSGANVIGVSLGGVLEYEFKPTQLDLKTNALKTGLITVEGSLLDDQTMINIIQTNTAADIATQESFIDFTFIDGNANNYPQVKIGAQVGQNADADSTIKEGSGAFVVHTSNAVDSTAGGQGGMAERLRVDYQGHLGLGTNNPGFRMHAYHPTTNVVARFESGDSQVYIDLHDPNSGTYGALLGHNSSKLFHIADASVADRLVLDNSGNLSVTGDVTAQGNMYINTANDGLYFSGGNNRIYFTNNRALEGDTGGTNLQVGEGYTNILAQGNLDVSGNITADSSNTTLTGSGSSGNAFVVNRGSDSSQSFRVQNSGEVVVSNNYLYASHSGTAFYSQGLAIFRGGIANDSGTLALNDNVVINGDLTVQSTASVGITINADTDNVTEADVPYLSFKMDGTGERLRMGVDSVNEPYISTDSDIALPLNIKTGTSDQLAMSFSASQNIGIPNGYLLIGADSGDGFNSNSDLRLQKANHNYLQIKTPTNKQAGVLIGDTDDDFVGGFIYDNNTDNLWLYSGNGVALTLDTNQNAEFAGNVNLTSGHSYKVNGLEVISSSRNLNNIGHLSMAGNIYMNKSQPWVIISNTTEDGGGVVFTDNQADSAGTGGPGSSSQAFRMTYHCGNETLIMGHDDDSYAGFNFGKGGDLTCSGNVTAYSDERLKDNIETLDGKKALEMRGVSFTKDGKEGSGVIAQELEKVAPELVTTDRVDGIKSVSYGNLVGYLIEAIKDQQKEIEYMKSEIKTLKENNNGN